MTNKDFISEVKRLLDTGEEGRVLIYTDSVWWVYAEVLNYVGIRFWVGRKRRNEEATSSLCVLTDYGCLAAYRLPNKINMQVFSAYKKLKSAGLTEKQYI